MTYFLQNELNYHLKIAALFKRITHLSKYFLSEAHACRVIKMEALGEN